MRNWRGRCERRADASSHDTSEGDPSCDVEKSPAEEPCTIDERFAVFVSTQGSDTSGRGDREAPFRTLRKAIGEAHAAGKRVYACDDGKGYFERLVIDGSLDGLAIYGGFECDGWSYGTGKAVVRPVTTGVALRIDDVKSGFYMRDFEIRAADATEPGESSIGVLVNASLGVVLERVGRIGSGRQRRREGVRGESQSGRGGAGVGLRIGGDDRRKGR